MFRVPKDTVMTPELLAKYIGKHKRLVSERLRPLQDAYENKYDIFDTVKITKKDIYKPDNRISVNHAKFIVDTFNGFFIGIPIKITVSEKIKDAQKQPKIKNIFSKLKQNNKEDDYTKQETDKGDKISQFIEMLNRNNSLDNKNREIAKLSDIQGSANEIYFTNEDGEIGIMQVSRLESFFIYDDSILQRPLFFIRYYMDSNKVERGSWSDNRVVQKFVKEGSYKWVEEAEPHYFDGVPATEYPENTERRGIFESELSAINEYNKALSEKANDVDYFADAYLKIIGPKVEKDDTAHMRANRLINFEGDEGTMPQIDFLQKPNADVTQENLLERLKADIFQMSMVPDINDKNFGTVSGVALKYRLLSMSNMAKVKQGLFKEALARRYKIIFSNPIAQTYGVNADDWMRLEYHFTENYPANVADEVDTARGLEGLVSKETQLKVLSIVNDVKSEIEKMDNEAHEKESENIIDRMMFGKDTAHGQSALLESKRRDTETA